MDKYMVYFLIGYKIYKEYYFEKRITNSVEENRNWSDSTIYNSIDKRETTYTLRNHFLIIKSRNCLMSEKNTNHSFYLECASEDLEKIKNVLTVKSLMKFFKKRF